MDHIIITTNAAVAVLCWLVAAAGATVAVFSKSINDTVTERFGLAWIAIACTGTACRVVAAGWISDGGLLLSASLAFYVCAVFWKHWKHVPGSAKDKK